jgi:predicted lipid-binding transport protein (Tim44 family)
MKRFLALALVVIAATALFGIDAAEAGRLGGGRSFGAQRQAIPPPARSPNVAPANPAAPAQAMPPKAAPAATGASRWLGPLAGLAAGIGLAALLSHFGLSEGFASILMLALLVFGAIFLIRMFIGRRDAARAPMQYVGAGAGSGSGSGSGESATPLPPSTQDRSNAFEPVFGGAPSAAAPFPAAPQATPPVANFPAGFDPAPFVAQATLQFRRLQAAYDAGDRKALADVLTPEMYAEIDRELAERGPHAATEVASLDATVLDVSTEGGNHWASVHFQGMLREDGAVLPKPFDEIWNLVKPVDGKSGWLLAGIRQTA